VTTEIEQSSATPATAQDDALAPATAPSNQYHLTFSNQFRDWMLHHKVGLALSTYEAGKAVMLGAGPNGYTASDETFNSAMAMLTTEKGFYLSMRHQVWRFENGLAKGQIFDGADRLYLPRQCQVTGGVDIHDLEVDRSGRLLAVVTLYNCIASLDHQGSFNPMWRPKFIDAIVAEDRCHLNGFCLKEGRLAYASIIGPSNKLDGWRDHRAAGGQVIEIQTDRVVAEGLAMPHSPRLYRGRLWVLEGGSGWFGWIDPKSGGFQRLTWIPGFLRGLRFVGDYAIIGSSRPRNAIFTGLPLQDELEQRGVEPICGLHVLNLTTGQVEHDIRVTGSVQEIYDLAVLPDTITPRLIGPGTDAAARLIFLGPDSSGARR
jgi:uncharacterized protein (TIGR03032 family)